MKMSGVKRSVEVDAESDSDLEEVLEVKKTKVRVKTTSVHAEFTRYIAQLPGGKSEERSQCSHCKCNYAGKNPTTLIKHLKSKHPSRAAVVMKKDEEQRSERLESFEVNSPSSSNRQTASEAFFGASRSRKEDTTQFKMDKYITKTKQRRSKSLPPRPREKEEESQRMLGYWVGGSTLPISFIEDPNFELYLQSYDIQVV